MLDKAFAGPRRRFLNVCTGECIRMDLPVLAEHMLLALTPEGLLLLLHEPTHMLRLLNPLTLQLTDLPPVTALLRPEQQQSMGWGLKLGDILEVLDASIVANASIVAVTFSDPMALAVAKPGDETWTAIDDRRTISTLPFGGRLYCASYLGVMVLNISSGQQPRLVMAAEWKKSFYLCQMSASLHLVDNGGELMLVHRMLCSDNDDEDDDDSHNHDEDDDHIYQTYSRKYEVYRVDLDAGILIPVKGMNGRAVFMSMTRSISVSAEVFPFVTADTIYLGSDCDTETLGYNLAYGNREPCNYGLFFDERVYPFSVVECLCYCIEGTGKLLA
uniref:KIB1-4 beta-propeller domain-containing protein n=1 Tax=Arundo donax TaxID=35708 RepID=A0A0A9FUP4_ARUDO